MKRVLLINPNSSAETTAMMVAIAQDAMGGELAVDGATATRAPSMIVLARELAAAASEVVEIGVAKAAGAAGIIVSAFGDPGLDALRREIAIPAVGICEGSMLEAAAGGRRFGVATVTPDLAGPIEGRVRALGLAPLYTGIRLTPGDPRVLASNADRLEKALAAAVADCIHRDGAQAVIIGGGPLGQAAIGLARSFPEPIIAPIPAAVRLLRARMH
ncbi:MAG TPA: aspartate/glutamate racemase family protein [Pseudolabrys sp.]|nr:aspartate/glutamate racemase family protein [Pseudolabrys sp.]